MSGVDPGQLQTEAAFRLAQQHQAAVGGDQAVIEGRCYFTCAGRLADRREEGYRRSWRAGTFSLLEKNGARTTTFYTMTTDYATLANPKSGPG